MTATVDYETPDGVQTHEPDETHTDTPQVVTCLWYREDSDGVAAKVQIPTTRVVRIVEHASEELL